MRNTFINELHSRMNSDNNIFFITADMGINLVEKIAESFPDRFLNVGIAEQNLIGVAAGLAKLGYTPYVYTISNFLVHRCLEQIRNDIVLHELPIKLIGTSTGFDNGPLGPTHHMLEDWGIINCLQNIEIYTPYNISTSLYVLDKIAKNNKTSYVRFPKGEGFEIKNKYESDTLIISYGSAISLALKISEKFKFELLPLIQLNKDAIKSDTNKLSKYSKIIVVEDHFSNCGLYGILTQILFEYKWQGDLIDISPSNYTHRVGYNFEDFIDFSILENYLKNII